MHPTQCRTSHGLYRWHLVGGVPNSQRHFDWNLCQGKENFLMILVLVLSTLTELGCQKCKRCQGSWKPSCRQIQTSLGRNPKPNGMNRQETNQVCEKESQVRAGAAEEKRCHLHHETKMSSAELSSRGGSAMSLQQRETPNPLPCAYLVVPPPNRRKGRLDDMLTWSSQSDSALFSWKHSVLRLGVYHVWPSGTESEWLGSGRNAYHYPTMTGLLLCSPP